MPTSKKDLQEALKDVLPDMGAMTKPELRHLFRQHIRGQRCRDDPTRNLASLSSAELTTRMQAHQLPVEPSMTKDAMIFTIRSHWSEQCAMVATSQPMGFAASCPTAVLEPRDEEDSVDSWEVASGEGNSIWYREIFSKLHLLQADAGHEQTLQAFLSACQKHPHLRDAASDVMKHHMAFVSSKSDLLEKLFSCDDAEHFEA